MTPLKLTRTGERRLLKLCDFLEKLPRGKFDFAAVRGERHCGTIGCAIGHTPEVFPRLVSAVGWTVITVTGQSGFSATGSFLFGISQKMAAYLFYPECQLSVSHDLPNLRSDATPKQVARMLRKFVRLAKEGKIEV